ncbi:quaternary ammonium compound efflux SMR transporter SugE [Adhaeribacter soli]|uniref:Guanidinium exporter n=1 Tax=Adhaeribacter soli TaxID=2607655 RepID=A0A5N1IXE0_9BACT|nr:quaternary ammonium compound efflux SMR transporter SugE [Adhaeribacter soli]KAA9332732.1 quaternary ammonium compound efflux SMR transporter SugE [Adhaeribacter soli]
MSWFILIIAGLFEIAWAVGLKYSAGLTKLWPSVFTLICLVISMGMLAYAVRNLPIGTAYAVWTGIGAVGTVILGMLLFNEPKDFARLFFIGLILTGIIGLKFFTK